MVIYDSNLVGFVCVSNISSTLRNFILWKIPSEHKVIQEGEYSIHVNSLLAVVQHARKLPHDKSIDTSALANMEALNVLGMGKYARVMPAREPNCYAVLHLTRSAPRYIVDTVFKALAARKHPDAGGSHEEFVALQQAYDQIKADIASRSPQ